MKTKIIVLTIVWHLLSLSLVFGEPSINSQSGTWDHKNTVTISGSGFGSKSPAAPLKWDDCEDKTVNNHAALASEYSQCQPADTREGEDIPVTHEIQYRRAPYTAVDTPIDAPHGHSAKFITGGHWENYVGTHSGRDVQITVATPSGFRSRWFATWYYRVDPSWPLCGNSPNHKFSVVQSGTQAYSNSPYTNQYRYMSFNNGDSPCTGNTYLKLRGHPGHTDSFTDGYCYDSTRNCCEYQPYFDNMPNPKNGWIRMEERIADDSSIGMRTLYVNNRLGWECTNCLNWFNGAFGGDGIRSYSIGGYYRHHLDGAGVQHNDAFRYFDDIYVDSTLSRVMLADAQNYENATIAEPQIPSAWSDNSITCGVNLGKLPDSGTAYLFVFDADNNHNPVGFPVELGGGSGDNPQISSVPSSFIHGSTVEITGTDFGNKNPAAPLLWDNCMDNPPLNTYYDAWLPTDAEQGSEYNMAYRDVNYRNIGSPDGHMTYMLGGAHAINRHTDTYSKGGTVGVGKNITSQSYFISYYYRVDPNFDEENYPTYEDNMKELVLSNTERDFYPDGWGAFGYANWCNGCVPDVNFNSDVVISRMPIDPANQDLPYGCSGNNITYHNNPVNGWIKMQWEGEYNHTFDGPQISLTTYPDGHRTDQSHYGDGLTVYEYARGPWYNYPKENDLQFIGLGGFARVARENNGVNSFRYFAGIYMDDTHSRVMMGDSPSYDSCTVMEPQIPSAWSDTSITATVNSGAFPDSGTAYLFVFDADNNHNPVGYPVEIGGGGGDNPPNVDITSHENPYSTSANTITISGSASDDSGIDSVTWRINQGESQQASNDSGDWESWSIPDISLEEGENVITVTATDTNNQTSTDTINVTHSSSSLNLAWSATEQTGDSTWGDSYVRYCVRLLAEGDYVTHSGSTIRLGFQGRSSGDYTIRKVSIAERDTSAGEGDVIGTTWTKVTFDQNSDSTWVDDVVTVQAGEEKLSDPIGFSIKAGTDYYITFKIDTPSVWLDPPAEYRELYFETEDHTDDINWSGNGYSTVRDCHAIASIYIVDSAELPPRDITNAYYYSNGNELTVAWTNPTSRDENAEVIPENHDFQGVMIRYNIGDAPYPANHTEGTLFGDEPGNLDENDSHEGFLVPGVYKFSFFTYDYEGHYSTTVHLFVDTMSPPPPVNVSPTIDSFTGMPASLNNPGETVTFNAFATDQDGDSLTYTINFGDGTASQSGSEAIHTYASAGTYTADVTVDDGHGNIVDKSLQIAVNDVSPAKPTSVTVK